MSEYVYAGLTSQTIDIFIRDSSSTTGQGLSGLVYNSASLVASYRKGATGSRIAITLATQTVGGAYSSGGFVEIDATNMKGVYRFDLVNASVDTEGFVTLFLSGAANMVPVALRIDCRPLPVDVKKLLGTAWLTPAVAGTPDVNVKLISGDSVAADNAEAFFDGTGYAGTGNVIPTVTNLTNLPAITSGWITAAGIAADAITAAKIADGAIDSATFASGTTIPRVTLADTLTTYTGNTPQTGDSFARIGTTGSGLTSLAPSTTALSTAVWTAGLATNLGTTNTTVASNLDQTISSRMATYTQPSGFLAASFPSDPADQSLIIAATDAILTAVGDVPTNAELATALGTADDVTLAAIAAEAVKTAAIKAKTDNLPTDPAEASDISSSFSVINTKLDTIDDLLDTEIPALTIAVSDIPTNSELATALAAADDAVLAAIAALNNLSAAQVNTEVLDALVTDTFGELSSPPSATSSLKDKLTWLFMWARNRSTESTTQRKLYADNSTTVVSTETVSDDGTTFSKTKAS